MNGIQVGFTSCILLVNLWDHFYNQSVIKGDIIALFFIIVKFTGVRLLYV